VDVLGLGHFVSGTFCERNLIHVVGIFCELECLWLGRLVRRYLGLNLFWDVMFFNTVRVRCGSEQIWC